MKLMRSYRLSLSVFGLFFLCSTLSVPVWAAKHSSLKTTSKGKKVYSVSAKSAILLNTTGGKSLFRKNSNQKVPPASTTKVMTALLVLEHLPLNSIVTVSSGAVNVQPSKINLAAGEQYRVKDLLYALLLNSANDASIVLAQAVAGSEQKFVRLMNDRARQLGAKNTLFVNSNGLPTHQVSQYTTAYDMSLIFVQALKHNFFRTAINTSYKTIYAQSGRKIFLKNHNKMLFTEWGDNIYGKTGYTKAAKSCFVGYTTKGKDVLIIAVFGCSRRWEDIRYIMRSYGGVTL